MNKDIFIKSAQEFVLKCGLTNWTVKLNNAKRSLWLCDETKKELRFSKFFIENNSDIEIKETLIHEVAHALAWNDKKHWPKWIQMAKLLGLKNPEQFNRTAVQAEWKYLMICPWCDAKHYFYKKPKKNWKACYECCVKYNRWKFDKRFELNPINFSFEK